MCLKFQDPVLFNDYKLIKDMQGVDRDSTFRSTMWTDITHWSKIHWAQINKV